MFLFELLVHSETIYLTETCTGFAPVGNKYYNHSKTILSNASKVISIVLCYKPTHMFDSQEIHIRCETSYAEMLRVQKVLLLGTRLLCQ